MLVLLLGCCFLCANGTAAVHSARTMALLLPESWSDALVKVLAVRLAVLLGRRAARQRSLPPRSGGLWCGLLALGRGQDARFLARLR